MEQPNKDIKLDDLLNELKTPKQEFPHQETTETTENKVPEGVKKVEQAKQNMYAVTGKILFHLIDVPITTVAAIIAGESVGKLRIDEESKKYLIDAYIQVAEAYQWENLPPWILLVAVGGSTYGGLLYNAYEVRKQKMKEKQKEETTNKPKLSVIKSKKAKTTNDATSDSKTNNNTGDQRNRQKHTGRKTTQNSKERADSNT